MALLSLLIILSMLKKSINLFQKIKNNSSVYCELEDPLWCSSL